MIGALTLWLPIVLSAVFVFIASSLIHMVFKYHHEDFKQLPSEDGVMDALRPFRIPPGEYVMPRANTMKDMETPEFKAKAEKGPVAFITVCSYEHNMGKSLTQWFVYCLLVGLFAAYLAGLSLSPGAAFLAVFRFVSTAAFAAYSLALLQNSIWYKRGWASTAKLMFDGFVYAAVTGATFGWLWP